MTGIRGIGATASVVEGVQSDLLVYLAVFRLLRLLCCCIVLVMDGAGGYGW